MAAPEGGNGAALAAAAAGQQEAAAGQQEAAAAQARAAMVADQNQWRVTWAEDPDPPEQDVIQKFRRAWAIAVSPARIERDPAWDYPREAEIWTLFTDPAVLSVVVATHPDGRAVTLARM